MTKPVIVGAICGIVIAGLCVLPRRWNLRLLLLTGMGVLSLGLAELGCSLLAGSEAVPIYDWDDRCLYKPRPGARKVFHRTPINGGQIAEVSINSKGYRGPELPADTEQPRVIIYGDSFIEGEYSQWDATFSEQLRQAATKLLGQPLAVVNAGVNGFGPDQSLLRMETELPQVRPQLVILAVFADNDYGDLLRNKLFRLNEQGQLVSNTWQRAADCPNPGLRGRYEPTLWKHARTAIRGIQSRRGGIESYMERWRRQCEAEYQEYVERGDSQVHDLQADHYDADVALTPGVPSAQYKARLFERILERIATTCYKNQAQFLLVIIPSPADLIEGYDYCEVDHKRYPNYDRRALTNLAAAAAKSHDVPYVNLYDRFSQSDPAKLYFRGGDNHWNDEGQRLAAETVAPRVVETFRAKRPK